MIREVIFNRKLRAYCISLLLCFFTAFSGSFCRGQSRNADITNDCTVDMDDLLVLVDLWVTDAGSGFLDDTDTTIDFSDFSLLARNWLNENCCIVISEFMASNHSALVDEDADYSDWIELYNSSSKDVDLEGTYLTDDPANLTKWRFPSVQIKAGRRLVVFASGKNRAVVGGELHTNFQLEAKGEYLAFVGSNGISVVDEYGPKYPKQFKDISYGPSQAAAGVVEIDPVMTYAIATDDTWQDMWMDVEFDDSTWSITQEGLGFGVESNPDLIAYWKLDESAGTVAHDSSGYGSDGTCQGGQEFGLNSLFGPVGKALFFDGIDDHIQIADDDILTPEHITIAYWVYPFGLGNGMQNIIAKRDANNNGSYVFESIASSTVAHWLNIDDSWYSLSIDYSNGKWQHIVVTYDGSAIKGYLDGQYLGNDTIVAGTINNDPGMLFFGKDPMSGGRLFQGSLDDIRIYSQALNADEIHLLYTYRSGETYTDVFDEMYEVSSSAQLRMKFSLDQYNVDRLDYLLLQMTYEDGYTAYLNGQKIGADNAPDTIGWNSEAMSDRSINLLKNVDETYIANVPGSLLAGENVIAIQGLNDAKDNHEFLMLPEITAVTKSGAKGYFGSPTPGAINNQASEGVVADVKFSFDRGFYFAPFYVTISTQTPQSQIYYTTDGSIPSANNVEAQLYTGPLRIRSTTVLRASAYRQGFLSTNVDTQTYIFPADVKKQNVMWTNITNDVTWGNMMGEALQAIPTISLVTHNTISLAERETSVELIFPDGTEGFQVDAGIEQFGGTSLGYPKKSMRISFKRRYGPARLDYDLFGGDAAKRFDQFLLRAGSHDTVFYTDPQTQTKGTYIRNRWSFDRQLDMGQPSPHGRFVHVYINGSYHGQYHLMERPNDAFMASYFGGDKEEYDALNSAVAIDGDTNAWNAMVASKGNYQELKKYMDVVNYADYMLLEFYAGNDWDWNHYQNWMAARKRAPGAGYKFFTWDSDIKLRRSVNANVINRGGPGNMWGSIKQHEEFRMLLADRAQLYFFNDGILTPNRVTEQFTQLATRIEKSVIAETARWGQAGGNYTPDRWQQEVDWVRTEFIPQRTDVVIQQMRDAGVFPLIDAPDFNTNGGYVPTGFNLAMSNPNGSGTIYYTLDGSDPLGEQPVIEPGDVLVPEDAAKLVYIPSTDIGTIWTGGDEPFDDSDWNHYTYIAGKTGGVGYENSSGIENYISYDVSATLSGQEKYAYIRIPFSVDADDLQNANILKLHVRYDDGFVAYINGEEVLKSPNISGQSEWTYTAGSHEADNTETFDISGHMDKLRIGDNILAFHGVNYSPNSSDFLVSAELSTGKSTTVDDIMKYTSPITLDQSTRVKARILSDSTWSALSDWTFGVTQVKENLRVTEIMYHPADPNEEFVELLNVGDETINLNLVRFTRGVDYDFGLLDVAPGEYILLVSNQVRFMERYPDFAGTIAGQYEGNLNNNNERMRIRNALGAIVQEFTYKDGWYDITDGGGFSLTIRDPYSNDPNTWDTKVAWRPSAVFGGSPGYDDAGLLPDPGSVVINEVLAHSHLTAPDWIELHNTTNVPINIGSWFLSDDNSDDPNIMKYEISSGTIIDAYGYVVFYEDETFGNPADLGSSIQFALSEGGDRVFLRSGAGGVVGGYEESESFGASASGVALGRHIKSTLDGGTNFVAMSANTPDTSNAYPMVGPIVISEIMYNPDNENTGGEYIELHNITSQPVTLSDQVTTENAPGVFITETGAWKFSDGITFTFDVTATIPAYGYLIIAENTTALTNYYGAIPQGVDVIPMGQSSLSNSGERLQIVRPGDREFGRNRYWIRTERVTYDDTAPWPTTPDGKGMSLSQKTPDTAGANYGNDADNWQATTPNPGQ